MGMGAAEVAHVQQFTYSRMETFDGRHQVEWAQVPGGSGWTSLIKGTTQPVTQYRSVRVLTPQNANDYRPRKWDVIPFLVGAVAIGFFAGMLMVQFLWHWRRRRYVWALMLPLVVAGFVSVIFGFDEEYERIRPW